jgi:hypothetical protein
MLTSEEMVKEANGLIKSIGLSNLKARAISTKRLNDEFEGAKVGIELMHGNVEYSILDIVDSNDVEINTLSNVKRVHGYIASYGVTIPGTRDDPPDYDVVELVISTSFDHVLGESILFIIKDIMDGFFEGIEEDRRYKEEQEMEF